MGIDRKIKNKKKEGITMKLGALEAGGTKMVCAIGDETGKILGGFVGGLTREWFSATSLMAFDYCIFVSSINRGSKVAYMLVTAFIEWAKEAGATIIQCGTATKINTERTISFYKKFGFEHTGSFLEMKL